MRSVATWLALCALAALLQEISSILPEDEPEIGHLTSEPRHISKRNSCHQSCDPYYVTLRNALHFRGNPYYQHHPNYGGATRICPGSRGGKVHVSPCLYSCPKHGESSSNGEYTIVDTDSLAQKYEANCCPDQCTEEKEKVSHPKTNEKTVVGSKNIDKINSGGSLDVINNGYTYTPDVGKRTGYDYESKGGFGNPLIGDSSGYPSVLHGKAGLVNTQHVSPVDIVSITTQKNTNTNLDAQISPEKETADISNAPDLSKNDPSINTPSPGQVINSPSSGTSPEFGSSSDVSKLGWSYKAQINPYPVEYQGGDEGSFSLSAKYDGTDGYPTLPRKHLTDSTFEGTILTDAIANQQDVEIHTKTELAEPPYTIGDGFLKENTFMTTKESGHDLLSNKSFSKTFTWPHDEKHDREKETGVSGGEATIQKSTDNKINFHYGYPKLIPSYHSSNPYAQQPQGLTNKPDAVFDVSSASTSPTNQFNLQYGYATLANRGTIPVPARDTSSNNLPYLQTQGISQNKGIYYGYPTVLGEKPLKKDIFGSKLPYSSDSILTNDNQITINGQKGMIIGESTQISNYPETSDGQINSKTVTNDGWTPNTGVPTEGPTPQSPDQKTTLPNEQYTTEYGGQIVYKNKGSPHQPVYKLTDKPVDGLTPDRISSFGRAPKPAVQDINTPTVYSTYYTQNTGVPTEGPTPQSPDQETTLPNNKYTTEYGGQIVYTNKGSPHQPVYKLTDKPVDGLTPDRISSFGRAPKPAVQDINTPTVYSTYYTPNTGVPTEGPTPQSPDQETKLPNEQYTTEYGGQIVYTNKGSPHQPVYKLTDKPVDGLTPDRISSFGRAPKPAVQDINTPTVYSTNYTPNTGVPTEGPTPQSPDQETTLPNEQYTTEYGGQIVYTNKGSPHQPVYKLTDKPVDGLTPDRISSFGRAPKPAVQDINTPTVYSTYYTPNTGVPSEGPISQPTDQETLPKGQYTTEYDGKVVYTNKGSPHQSVYQPIDKPVDGLTPDQISTFGRAPKPAVQDINTPTVYSTYYTPNTGVPPEEPIPQSPDQENTLPNGKYTTEYDGKVVYTNKGLPHQSVYQPTDKLVEGLTTDQTSLYRGAPTPAVQDINTPTVYSTYYQRTPNTGVPSEGPISQPTDQETFPKGQYTTEYDGKVVYTNKGSPHQSVYQLADKPVDGLTPDQISSFGRAPKPAVQDINTPTVYSTYYTPNTGVLSEGPTPQSPDQENALPKGQYTTEYGGQIVYTNKGSPHQPVYKLTDKPVDGLTPDRISSFGRAPKPAVQDINTPTVYSTYYTPNTGVPTEGPTPQSPDQENTLPNAKYTTEYDGKIVYTNKGSPHQSVYQLTDKPVDGLTPDQISLFGRAPKPAVQDINTPTVYSTYYTPNTGVPTEGPTPQSPDQENTLPNAKYTTEYDSKIVYTNKGSPHQSVYQLTDKPVDGLTPDQISLFGSAPKPAVQDINTPTVYSTYYTPNTGVPSEGPMPQSPDQETTLPNQDYTTKYGKVFDPKEGLTQQSVNQPTDQLATYNPTTGYNYELHNNDRSTAKYIQNSPLSNIYGYNYERNPPFLVGPQISSPYYKTGSGGIQIPNVSKGGVIYPLNNEGGVKNIYETTSTYDQKLGGSSSPDTKDMDGNRNLENQGMKTTFYSTTSSDNFKKELSTAHGELRYEGTPDKSQISTAGNLASVIGDTTSVAGDLTSAAGDLTSVIGDTTSVIGDTTSVAGDLTSTAGDLTSVIGDTTSVIGDTTSVAGDLTSTAGDLTSAAGITSVAGDLEGTAPATSENTRGATGKQESTSLQGVKPDLIFDDENDKVVTVSGYSMKQSQLNDIINSFKSPEKSTFTMPQVCSGPLDQYIHVIKSYPASVRANDAFVHLPSDLIVPLHCYKALASVYAPDSPLFTDVCGTVLTSGHFVKSSTIGNILASVKAPEEVIIMTPTGHAVPYPVYSKYMDRISPKDKKMLKIVVRGEKDHIPYEIYKAVLNKYITKPPPGPESKKGIIKLLSSNIEMPLIQFLSILENHSRIKDATVTLPNHRVLSLKDFQPLAKILGKDYTQLCIVNMPNTDTRVPYTVMEDIFKTYLGNKPIDLTKDTDVNFKFPTDENPDFFGDKLGDGVSPVFETAGEHGYSLYGGPGVKGYGHRGYPNHPRLRHFLTEAAEAVDQESSCPYPRDYPPTKPKGESILDMLHPRHTELMGLCPYIDHYCRRYQRKNKGKNIFER